MKSGRFIHASALRGDLAAEVEHTNDHGPGGPQQHTEIRVKADAVMDEESWRQFVERVNDSIDKEKRGGC